MHIEHKFRLIVSAIFQVANLVHHGALLDAGANNGQDTVFFAGFDRPVLALEIMPKVFNMLQRTTRSLQNVTTIQAGLANSTGLVSLPCSLTRGLQQFTHQTFEAQASHMRQDTNCSASSANVIAVDTLFEKRTLAFAHWDVEGMEVEVLNGARHTIARDRPLFSVEAYPNSSRTSFKELMRLVSEHGYQAYMITERCGRPFDCRNYLCVPHERVELFHTANWSSEQLVPYFV